MAGGGAARVVGPPAVPADLLRRLPQRDREVEPLRDEGPRGPRGDLRRLLHHAQAEGRLPVVEEVVHRDLRDGTREGRLLRVEELDVLLRERALRLELVEVPEEAVVELLPDRLRLPERLLVPEAQGQAAPLGPDAGAPRQVPAQAR